MDATGGIRIIRDDPMPEQNAADTHFRALLERHADYIPAYLMYGHLLARQSCNDEAKQVLSKGIAAATKGRNEHARSEMEALLNDIS